MRIGADAATEDHEVDGATTGTAQPADSANPLHWKPFDRDACFSRDCF